MKMPMRMGAGLIVVVWMALVSQSVLADRLETFLTEARLANAKKEYERAIILYRKYLNQHPEHSAARRELSALLMRAHIEDPHSGAELFEFKKLSAYHPGVPGLPDEFPMSYLENGLLEMKHGASDYETLLVMTQIYHHDEKASLESANKLVTRYPNDPVAHNLLGLACLLNHSENEAQLHFQKALRLKPDFHKAGINLARSELERGNYKMARETLQMILKQDAGCQEANLLMSEVARFEGNAEEENQRLQQTLKHL